MKELKKDFFKKDALFVANALVGKILCVDDVCGRILEVEAYMGDKASHARKKTPRSSIMFDSFGKVYVYLIYGMYHCLNFTCDSEGPGAVLIRSVNLIGCSGPGKLCRTLGISVKDNNSFVGDRIKVFDDSEKFDIVKTSRVGIKEDVNLQWRFLIKK